MRYSCAAKQEKGGVSWARNSRVQQPAATRWAGPGFESAGDKRAALRAPDGELRDTHRPLTGLEALGPIPWTQPPGPGNNHWHKSWFSFFTASSRLCRRAHTHLLAARRCSRTTQGWLKANCRNKIVISLLLSILQQKFSGSRLGYLGFYRVTQNPPNLLCLTSQPAPRRLFLEYNDILGCTTKLQLDVQHQLCTHLPSSDMVESMLNYYRGKECDLSQKSKVTCSFLTCVSSPKNWKGLETHRKMRH